MLTDSKPKMQKMAFTIENLARSSQDEVREDKSNNTLENTNKQRLSASPCITPSAYGSYSPVFYSGFYSPCFPTASSGSSVSPVPRESPNQSTVMCNSKTTPTPSCPRTRKSPLRLPLASEKSQLKRKRDDSCDSGVESPSPERSRHTSEASFSSNSSYTSDIDDLGEDMQKKKKARTAFTTEQISELEKRYSVQKYLPANERNLLAERLGLADQQVKTWFQNRRMKEKRQQRDDEHARSFALPTGGVDVAQLAALGVPCPPPYNVQGTPVRALPGMSPVNFISSHYMHTSQMPHHRSMPYPGVFGSPAYPGQGVATHVSPMNQPLHISTRVEPRHSPIDKKTL